MLEENRIVHTLWVGQELSKLECLTIKLLQSHEHIVFLWCYDVVKNVPSGTIIKNASEILGQETIFKYAGQPLGGIPNGGIGSLSHWSDQFQLKLLQLYGGIYIQLDVACLLPLDFKEEYAFISHQTGSDIAAFLMKAPKGSKFTEQTFIELQETVNPQTMSQLHWDDSMRAIGRCLNKHILNLEKYKINPKHYVDLGCRGDGPFFDGNPLNSNIYIIHWSNATVREKKNNPIKGSFYEKLLLQNRLI